MEKKESFETKVNKWIAQLPEKAVLEKRDISEHCSKYQVILDARIVDPLELDKTNGYARDMDVRIATVDAPAKEVAKTLVEYLRSEGEFRCFKDYSVFTGQPHTDSAWRTELIIDNYDALPERIKKESLATVGLIASHLDKSRSVDFVLKAADYNTRITLYRNEDGTTLVHMWYTDDKPRDNTREFEFRTERRLMEKLSKAGTVQFQTEQDYRIKDADWSVKIIYQISKK